MARTIRLIYCLLSILLPSTLFGTAVYTELGAPDGYTRFDAVAVSADGGTIVGMAYDASSVSEVFIWREGTGFFGLASVVVDQTIVSSYAADISGDGTVVVGWVNRQAGVGVVEPSAFLWTVPTDDGAIGYREFRYDLGGRNLRFIPAALSRDGAVVVGTYQDTIPACPGSFYPADEIGFGARFVVADSAFEPLGSLPDGDCTNLQYGGVPSTVVRGVSADGSVVVGSAGRQIANQFNSLSPIYEAFAWNGTIAGLDDVSDETHSSYGRGVNDDGSVILGVYTVRNTSGQDVSDIVRWINGSRQSLGFPNEILYGSWESLGGGLGMCDNGDCVWYDSTVWSAGNGWQSIEELAISLGITFDGFLYQIRPTDMSADGNVIIGTGWTGSQIGSWRIIRNACPDYQSGRNVSEWYLGGNGLFGDDQSWENNQLPGVLSYGWFDVTGTPFTVSLDRSHALGGIRHSAGDVTFDLAGHTLSLGSPAECGPALQSGEDDQIPVNLTFRNGRLTVNGNAQFIGGDLSSCSFDDTSIVEIQGSMYVNGPPTHVVGIGDNPYLDVTEQLILGHSFEKRGELLLAGEQSSLNARTLIIGNDGWGKCTADTGSLTTADSLQIGYGIGGTGELLVKGGATVAADWITMSLSGETQSFVTLQDGGSELLCGTMIVGLSDSARVSVIDSASLGLPDSSWIAAGFIADAAGDIVVSGPGSTIQAKTIDIAVGGLGDLQVLDGAQVGIPGNVIERLNVASDSGSAGSVLVSGNFAQILADTMTVGLGGVGILQCDPTGYVQVNDLYIGPLGSIIGNALAIDTYELKQPTSSLAATETGFAVRALTLESGASVTVDSVLLGPGGTLAGSGEVALDLTNDGSLSPGDSTGELATFTVTGDYVQTASGELAIDLGDKSSDLLAVAGTAELDGSLRLALPAGYYPEPGDEYVVLTANAIVGTFATVEQPSDVQIDLVYTADTVKAVVNIVTDVVTDPSATLPETYALQQNYPNPFNPTTEIEFSLPVAGHVRVDVINLLGQRITTLVDRHLPAGDNVVTWNGTDRSGRPVASGIYFYRLSTVEFSASRKMLLLK